MISAEPLIWPLHANDNGMFFVEGKLAEGMSFDAICDYAEEVYTQWPAESHAHFLDRIRGPR